MCRKQMWIPVFLCLLAQFAPGCGPIPNDSASDSSSSDGRVYINEEWGFQLTIPDDSTWSWNSRTLFQNRESNGLPRVNVLILKNPLEGRRFRPTLSVDPRGVSAGTLFETFVASLEEDFKARFIGYNAEEKRTLQVSSAEAVEWTFRVARIGGFANRFLVAVVMRERQGYVMLGSGISSHFPVEGYRQITSSLKFLR